MNPVTEAAAQQASYGWLMSGITALFFVMFMMWTWYAYRPANRARHDEAARLPLQDDELGGTP
ncbi:MAG TPA: cbb3-type cytochrome c oxidase subunit 3 [Myxococcota bacterium]|nr:cbb3-type cytochrome c oxidase subunit 3 [Myxococcota bacterium]